MSIQIKTLDSYVESSEISTELNNFNGSIITVYKELTDEIYNSRVVFSPEDEINRKITYTVPFEFQQILGFTVNGIVYTPSFISSESQNEFTVSDDVPFIFGKDRIYIMTLISVNNVIMNQDIVDVDNYNTSYDETLGSCTVSINDFNHKDNFIRIDAVFINGLVYGEGEFSYNNDTHQLSINYNITEKDKLSLYICYAK